MSATGAMTLSELASMVSGCLSVPALQQRWVTAEVMDLAVRGGHCYMELVDKDPESGRNLARMRAIIWANMYAYLDARFHEATGQRFASGMKVMVKVSVNFHGVFGMSLIISDINPEYTMGDLLRRRNQMIARLKEEGIYDMNRSLAWPVPALRIAIVSAKGAAGYGDFMNQLYSNGRNLRFTTRLYPAVMQGERAPESIIAALGIIATEEVLWDCVVIIRGGGSTSDLVSMDNYELAAHVAQFPLPVIVGIGHERDITILDYVANMRVKTPTAAAEWIIGRAVESLMHLKDLASGILRAVTDRISGNSRQLAMMQGQIPALAENALQRAESRLRRDAMAIGSVSSSKISRGLDRLAHISENLATGIDNTMRRRREKLDNAEAVLKALSPEAVLKRGYSITRLNGESVKSSTVLNPGDTIVTTFASGTVESIVK